MKAYHFLDVETLTLFDDVQEGTAVSTEQQLAAEKSDDQPISTLQLIKRDYYSGFDKYIIKHEKIKRKQGRAYGENLIFNQFVENHSMNAYYNSSKKLFLVEGNKAAVNDFKKKFEKQHANKFKLNRSNVDFPYLILHTQNVWGGWLNGFNDGNLKSVALYGDHVNLSEDYNRYEAAGRLSSLNCSITFEKRSYDFMITVNKTVVIMQNRTDVEDIDLLMFIRPMLYKEIPEEGEGL
ncbi:MULTISPECIES: hypothetical protein [Peribacillus]|uniref:hypothetical protein n=1 Tax=Peribacillus TaxID=2675229 RepID=UPI001F4F0545|nr:MULTISPECIES: hypothetical protein [unclassified Peribacillus]MCK1986252.1 hypothetical protein [Peribacillus sp. Aquil_B1]MCK2010391.1 hypothetical protein [Peribacillus sp. Aquil_B8]